MSQKITDEELLEELSNIVKQFGRVPSRKEFETNTKFSRNAYNRAFGGLNPALKLIGITPTMEFNHTKEQAIAELIKIKNELGHIPSIKEFSELANMSHRTVRNIFNNKTWANICIEILSI